MIEVKVLTMQSACRICQPIVIFACLSHYRKDICLYRIQSNIGSLEQGCIPLQPEVSNKINSLVEVQTSSLIYYLEKNNNYLNKPVYQYSSHASIYVLLNYLHVVHCWPSLLLTMPNISTKINSLQN